MSPSDDAEMINEDAPEAETGKAKHRHASYKELRALEDALHAATIPHSEVAATRIWRSGQDFNTVAADVSSELNGKHAARVAGLLGWTILQDENDPITGTLLARFQGRIVALEKRIAAMEYITNGTSVKVDSRSVTADDVGSSDSKVRPGRDRGKFTKTTPSGADESSSGS